MVKLEEVSPDQVEYDESLSDNDSESLYSDDMSDDFDEEDETLAERIAALKDIIPLRHRRQLTTGFSRLTLWGKKGATFVGKSAWVLTTSMLLLVLPLALAIEKEQALLAYEKEAMQQQGTQQMLGGGMTLDQPKENKDAKA